MLQIAPWKRILILLITALFVGSAIPNLFYNRVETHNDAIKKIESGGETPQLVAARDDWPSWAPDRLVNLGLDLRGGAHLLAEVHLSEVYEDRMNGYWPEVRDALRELRDEVGGIRRVDSNSGDLRIRLAKPEGMAAALEKVRSLAQPVASLSNIGAKDIDVRGEGDILIVSLSDAEKMATDDRTMQQSLEIIRRRVDEVGTREPTIQRQGDDRILIEVPGIGSAAELKAIIGTTAKLTFQPVVGRTTDPDAVPGPNNELLPSADEKGVYYVLEQTAVVTGDELTDAQPSFDQNGRPAVSFTFNPTGARKFGIYTAEHIGEPFAIVLDNQVISAPTIQSAIPGGSGIITGNFSLEESTNLAVLLRAGALPAGMTFLEERTIGPELGADSIAAGKLAAIVGSVLVVVFMAAAYGLFGWFANIALTVNLAMMFGALSMIGGTLTLPGIAGIVLTVGMAVDANVLIYERIREELKNTKGPARAIELGYEKALSAILDSNITTLITAAILFVLGTGPVKGFAVTLALGILTSVFTAYFVTRLMVISYFHRKRPKSVLQWGLRLVKDNTNIDFFRIARVTFGGSVVLLIASIIVTVAMGLNFGIDFRGGTTIRTESTQQVDVGAYREALTPLKLGDVSIAEVFDPSFGPDQNVAQIRIQAQDGDEAITSETIDKVEAALRAVDPDVTFPSVESVGPKVSKELILDAIMAVLAAVTAITVYIWLRFEWQFAVGALVGLVHDVGLTIGLFSLFQIKFDLSIIAALLTIVGYSINDTVVVFDRARENLIKYKQRALRDVLNLSANETLSRTIMTSGTTLVALLALLIFGGDVIRGFVFAITWGIVVGTYSSIYISKNIVLMLGVKRDWSKPVAEGTAGTQFSTKEG
ncbi:protein translocase subunit SecD [Frigidibacter sp. ROC022]|uniref:protein translocase subunit SecD n=1 Tax=Frigidibacter sp. ROC022 TaxID=2971796 RepID=UPI00215B1498|nr:protein translocase subunit SecD [Frigidibacter sp. ROC022]MCR8723921.1 protein translocase subunit SecD [Frigidibacter sp. ROC022]